MKLILTVIFFFQFLVILAQDTIELQLYDIDSSKIFLSVADTSSNFDILNEELFLDSICKQKLKDYIFHCSTMESKLKDAENEADSLNIKNISNGFFYVVEYEDNFAYNWDYCTKYFEITSLKNHCQISEIEIVRKSKNISIIDPRLYYDNRYNEEAEIQHLAYMDTKRNHKKACRKFEKELFKVEEVLFKVEHLLENEEFSFSNKGFRQIWYFEELTGIGRYTVNYDYGIITPNKEDLDAWKEWYILNKDNLYWNRKTRLIELSKNESPTRPNLND